MAGFFYLGGRLVEEGPGPVPPPQASASSSKQEEEEKAAAAAEDQEIRAHNLFLYRNQEIYNNNNNSNKGSLEIWPTQYNHLQLQAQNLNINNYLSFGVGPSRVSDESSGGIMMPQLLGGGGHGLGSVGGGGTNCQDCGNQAKKDCPHLRCRTCCKSRGLPCQTHVKSTWVPAAKRRERQQQQQPQQNQPQQEQQLFINSNPKRPRENRLATSVATSSHHHRDLVASHADRLPSSTSGLEVAQFPAEVSSPAVFRCVKVSSMDDADEEFAYQAAVNIGGHVFKGILYDQGPDRNYTTPVGESSLGHGNVIGATNTTMVMTNTNPPGVTLLQVDHSSLYPAPLNAFMAGTQFFPPSRS